MEDSTSPPHIDTVRYFPIRHEVIDYDDGGVKLFCWIGHTAQYCIVFWCARNPLRRNSRSKACVQDYSSRAQEYFAHFLTRWCRKLLSFVSKRKKQCLNTFEHPYMMVLASARIFKKRFTLQRRLAWSLSKNDTHNRREATLFFFYLAHWYALLLGFEWPCFRLLHRRFASSYCVDDIESCIY